MPVRFKGLSEYQRNFLWKKSYLAESYNPSLGRRYPLAGLRSDQIGITKEPSFISKRRVPYHDPQISKSLEWNGANSENHAVISPEPEAPGSTNPQEAEQKEVVNQEGVLSLEATRVPKRTRSHSADSRAGGASDVVEKNEGVITSRIPVNKTVEPDNSTKLSSENVENGVFYNKSKFVPQLKGNSIVHETEYKRNFKGLSPVKESKLNDLKENRNLETVSPEKKSNKMDDPVTLEAEMASKDSNKPKKTATPWRHQRLGKVNSEYRAKFLSPAQYLYKAGTWTRVKENMPSQVKELREKAEFYRKRVQGTHFSRDHLNQIVSDNNCCWDVSSTTSSEGTVSSNIRALDLARDHTCHKTLQKHSPTKPEVKKGILEEPSQQNATDKLDMSDAPTIPVSRRLAWDAENTGEDGRKRLEQEEEQGRDKPSCMEELEMLDVHEKSKADKIKEGSDISSVSSSGKGGRLPTPKLKELGGIQRTHHDLTTPAVGGAVLVSPSKGKPPVSEQRKRMFSQDGLETSKNVFTKKENHTKYRLTSPTAGIKTIDPLPLREDSEAINPKFAEATLPVSNNPEYSANTPGQLPSPPQAPSYWHPSCRIQGSLRHPEFQHNVGKARMNNSQLPPHEAFHNEDEDRLSEISARSVATSLRAYQTLARAQKRKENFWGKT
ncbi:nuclear protein MDM1 isoform X6 [Dipodomys merriami]|uniref:nuclear protein MDM1 isoform X6 n=1 Tax=Dipodomys merriami TaxID=94247 RepID=UPI00384B23BF